VVTGRLGEQDAREDLRHVFHVHEQTHEALLRQVHGLPRAASTMICTWSTEPRTLSGPVTLAGRTPMIDMP
jgi:hypothetical protein